MGLRQIRGRRGVAAVGPKAAQASKFADPLERQSGALMRAATPKFSRTRPCLTESAAIAYVPGAILRVDGGAWV
jgi:hypothetical protein